MLRFDLDTEEAGKAIVTVSFKGRKVGTLWLYPDEYRELQAWCEPVREEGD